MFTKKFLLLFSLIILPNLPFLLLANHYSLVRSVINIDYLLAGSLFLLGAWPVGALVFIVAYFFDALVLLSQLFPFFRLDEVVYMSKFIFQAPVSYRAGVLLLFFSAFVLVAIYYFIFARPVISKAGFLVCFVLLGSCFAASNSVSENRVTYRIPPSSFVSSQTDYLISSRAFGFSERVRQGGADFAKYLGERASGELLSDELVSNKVLFVVAESWGVPNDYEIQKGVLSPILKLENYKVDKGVFDFSGATVEGELRELCGISPSSFDVRGIPEKYSNECLPNLFKEMGYSTLSLHGASSTMYDRYIWYPKIGFDQSLFFEDKVWSRRCFSFPGACDLDMFEYVENFFESNSKGFLYWLTLNSHSPYDERDILVDYFDCKLYGVESDEVCRSLKLHAQFFYSLADFLSSENMRDVEVVVVSDHEPRVMDRDDLVRYFEIGVVPWLRMKPVASF